MAKSEQKQPETKFTTTPNDTVLNLLEKVGLPKTRENYLKVAYLGQVPDPLPAELEEELPPFLQAEPKEKPEPF